MTSLFLPWLSCLCSLGCLYVWHSCWQVNACLGCTYKLAYLLLFFFLLFVGLMWVTHLFYLIFIFYFQQKLDKLFLNEHNLLVCVFVCISVISFFKSKHKLGERKKKKNNKSSKHNLTWAKRLFIWHFLTRAFYLSGACHIVMSTLHATRFQKETSTALKKIKEI